MRARRLAPAVLMLLCACGKDSHFTDANPGIDARAIDSGGNLPVVAFPSSIPLGAGDCGADATVTFDAENTGGGDLEYTITPSTSIFEVSPAAGTILASTTTTFTVTAHVPADAVPGTPVTGQLSIATNLGADPVVITLSLDPTGGVVTFDPTSAGFGDVELTTSAQTTVTVHNTGNADVSVAIGTPSTNEFTVDFTGGLVAASGQRDATVHYTPGGLGAASATSTVTITGAVCGTAPTSLAMGGSGLPVGSVLVTGNAAFGSITCGTTTTDNRTITLDNRGAVDATWTAAFLADAEGDDALYMLSAASGTVPAHQTATIDVTRLAIALPATPGAHDATLRIVTTVAAVPTNHDLSVTQQLSGPYLTASVPSIDFGFAPVDESVASTITVTNTGNSSASATYTASGAYFSASTSGSTIAGSGGIASFDGTYAPTALGTATGDVAISAPGSCSDATVTFDAGNGPWASFNDALVTYTCGNGVAPIGLVNVQNLGNRSLTISGCTDISGTDIDPVFSPDPYTIGPASLGISGLTYSWQMPSPSHSGATTATIRCDTNEPINTTRTFDLTRQINGMDLVLTPVDTFDVSCNGQFNEHHYLQVHNEGNLAGFLYSDISVPSGLYGLYSSFTLQPAGTDSTIGVGLGSACTSGGSGYVGVGTGSANVCSATPGATLPVSTTP